MTTELLIANKATGQLLECSGVVRDVSWETNRTGTPGKLTFTLIKAGGISFTEGDVVRFSVDGVLQFYGWVFTKKKDRWGVIDVTCYDRLRYLKTSASYAFYGLTAGEIILRIAGDLQLTTGDIVDTGYPIPALIEEEQSCLDIIGEAVQQTLLNTGTVFVFYDDGNGLALQASGALMATEVIGDGSRLLNYEYKTDIDEQTYNQIKLARPNESTGRADVVIATDSDTIGQWGLLQLYQTVDTSVNDAQMQAQAVETLAYYNRRMQTLTFDSLGILGLRAGQMVYMQVDGLGDINLNQYVLLERVAHKWENGIHTMSCDTLPL